MSAASLPRMLDRKTLAAELGVALHTAERIMRHCDQIKVGRRYFVTDTDARAALEKLTIRSSDTSSKGIT